MENSGILSTEVNKAISQDIIKNIPKQGGSYTGKINIKGKEITYRAYNRGNDTINVGTYFFKK